MQMLFDHFPKVFCFTIIPLLYCLPTITYHTIKCRSEIGNNGSLGKSVVKLN